jgi:hypothetical protein
MIHFVRRIVRAGWAVALVLAVAVALSGCASGSRGSHVRVLGPLTDNQQSLLVDYNSALRAESLRSLQRLAIPGLVVRAIPADQARRARGGRTTYTVAPEDISVVARSVTVKYADGSTRIIGIEKVGKRWYVAIGHTPATQQ